MKIETIEEFIASRGTHFGDEYAPEEEAYWLEQRLLLNNRNAMSFPGQSKPVEMWEELRKIDEGIK